MSPEASYSTEVVVPTDPRSPLSFSPKVVIPVAAQLLGLIVLGFVTGDFNAPEISLACSALVTAVLGYATNDPARKGPRGSVVVDDAGDAVIVPAKPHVVGSNIRPIDTAGPPPTGGFAS